MKAYTIDTEAVKITPALRRALLAALGLAAAVPLLGLTSGCIVTARPAPVAYAEPAGEVYVDAAPPAPIVESVGVVPGPGFVWIGGYFHWYGNRWGWVAGHYARPPRRGASWVGPRYELRGGRRVYIRGYWR
jgi:hypothetical protein